MAQRYNIVTFKDELLTDGSVRRAYSDGRSEWRRRVTDVLVQWQDSAGSSGTDEQLNGEVIKRTFANGRVLYAREQGYGRTAWSDGSLTVNRSSFGGQVGTVLAALGAGALMGSLVPPPEVLGVEEEEELRRQFEDEQRRQQAARESTSSSDSGSSSDDGGDEDKGRGDFGDGGDDGFGGDGDFG